MIESCRVTDLVHGDAEEVERGRRTAVAPLPATAEDHVPLVDRDTSRSPHVRDGNSAATTGIAELHDVLPVSAPDWRGGCCRSTPSRRSPHRRRPPRHRCLSACPTTSWKTNIRVADVYLPALCCRPGRKADQGVAGFGRLAPACVRAALQPRRMLLRMQDKRVTLELDHSLSCADTRGLQQPLAPRPPARADVRPRSLVQPTPKSTSQTPR